MKRDKIFSFLLLVFIMGAGLSCSKDIMNRTENAPALNPPVQMPTQEPGV